MCDSQLAASLAVANNQLTKPNYPPAPSAAFPPAAGNNMELAISSYLSSTSISPTPSSTGTPGDYMELAIASYLSSDDYLSSPSPPATPSCYSPSPSVFTFETGDARQMLDNYLSYPAAKPSSPQPTYTARKDMEQAIASYLSPHNYSATTVHGHGS